jgi:glycosyltransferase involved in cell wall biosynthesis
LKSGANASSSTLTASQREKEFEMMLAHHASSSLPALPVSSIIIPVRNAEPYLNDCIQSILDQTVRPLQICAHDDNSSDGSLQLLLQWQHQISGKHPDVSMVVTSGSSCRGVGGARNAAIASSAAEWLCFLDADDIMRPNRIDLQVCLLYCATSLLILTITPLQLQALRQLGPAAKRTIMGGNFSRLPVDATPRYLSFHQSLRSDDLNFMWAVSFRRVARFTAAQLLASRVSAQGLPHRNAHLDHAPRGVHGG